MAYKGKNKGKRTHGRSRGRPQAAQETRDLTLRVTELGRHCDGIASDGADGDRYFVGHVVPGELVRVRAAGNRAELLEVIEPSPDRVAAFCQHYGKCGGCSAQHLGSRAYGDWKSDIITKALNNQGLEMAIDDLIDAHGDGRRRVTFHLQIQNGKVRAGFMQPRSRDLVEIVDCPILSPALKDTPKLVQALAQPFVNSVRQLDMALTETTNGVDCDIRGAETITYDMHVSLAQLADQWNLARITLDGVIELERHKPMLPVGAVAIPLPPGSFLQATTLGEDTLAGLVERELGTAKKVADLFCGVGPYALRFARQARVYAADSNQVAIAALGHGARHGVGLKQIDAEVRDLFRNPVFRDDLGSFDVVILNPARAGAQAQSEELAASEVPLVVYVSCDPATLARDARILVDGGFKLARLTAVDQFKYAAHIETVAVFRRG